MNRCKTLYDSWFPPIYKNGGGLPYSFRVFLTQVKLICIVSVLWLVALGTVSWILPASLSSAADWLFVVKRIAIVAFVAYIGVRAYPLYRSLTTRSPRLAGKELEEAEAAERELFAKLIAATAMAASPIVVRGPSDAEQEAMSRVIWETAKLLHKRESAPYFRELTAPNSHLMHRAVSLGFAVTYLFRVAGYKLLASRSKAKRAVPSGLHAAIERLLPTFTPPEFVIESKPSLPRESLESLTRMIQLERPELDPPRSLRRSDTLIEWLTSMSIQIRPLCANVGDAHLGDKGD